MAMYVVKNAHGKWLSYDYDGHWWAWASDKESRHTWSYKPDAVAKARSNGGKVYRVRPWTAERERDAVVRFIERLVGGERQRAIARVLNDVARRIGDHEHRRAE
jgi:hypothetical protein